jgi:outer membrane immunogenic protein
MKNVSKVGTLISGAVFGALVAGSAMAADMAVKAPLLKAPAPVYNWTGCYVNAGAGYSMWNQDATFESIPGLVPVATATLGGRGWFGTVGVGCDYQVSSSIVIGVLGDWDFGDIKGQFTDPADSDVGTESQKRTWAIGGRLGWLVTPTFMTYVSAGYTQTQFDQVNFTTIFGPTVDGSMQAQTYQGWFLASGFEYALSNSFIPLPPGFFLRSEYRYSTYKAVDIPFLDNLGVPEGDGINSKKFTQSVRTSLVWRFNMTH